MRAALPVLTLLAACAAAPDRPADAPPPLLPGDVVLGGGPPEGGWPAMGRVEARLDGRPHEWTTFDYSLGAFSASAWIARRDEAPQMSLRALPDGNPEAEGGWLFARGTLADLAPGPTDDALVALTLEDSVVGPRWQSRPGTATLVLETLEREAGAVYGRGTGSFAATLCRTDGEAEIFDPGDCRQIEGRFNTELQFDGT
ncbi:hypothetical protein [Wenxinia saemankumensis]|uniref:Uncharacterized protein n=1 Tax=Wenxinia saemankumensis TaxID=1447782 RepID=A0A1M6GP21_9RHOB|nr:hypothetical protein [Wenxinia saemankumensis]SHJ11606.1 hypothetical protein SAMN05444417_2832 [Wenxinia saemankumensis]